MREREKQKGKEMKRFVCGVTLSYLRVCFCVMEGVSVFSPSRFRLSQIALSVGQSFYWEGEKGGRDGDCE
jgi:hypothetical protein